MTTSFTLIEIQPKNGGFDAETFTSELKDSLMKALRLKNYETTCSELSEQRKSFIIKTTAPLKKVKWLEGYHTIQRIPQGSSARHTSSAVVIVRNERTKADDELTIDMKDVRIDRYRGTGRGGQRKNKVSTAIRVVHVPTGITITRETGRSQGDNLDSALEQLQSELDRRNRVSRDQQVVADRQVAAAVKHKDFTHNYQRGEVVAHATGARWSAKHWNSGKIWSTQG